MSILLNDNLSIQAPKATDSRYGPYADVATALTSVVLANRYLGLTVGIGTTTIIEYWFRDGTADANLILKVDNTANTSSANTIFTQGVDLSQNTSINNKLSLTGSPNQTVSGNVTISQDLIVSGNLILTGNISSQNVQQLAVADPLIVLGLGNYVSDTKDIGFAGHYNDGQNAHTGIVRDSVTKEWYVFKGYTPELDSNNNVIITDPSFVTANLNANVFKGNLIGNSIVINGLDLYNYSTSSFAQANLTAGGLVTANANTIYTQGVDSTQNTWISSNSLYSQAAFALANLTSGGLSTANANTVFLTGALATTNANTIFLSGVNTTQNTWISSNSLYSQSAFAQANLTAGGLSTANANTVFLTGALATTNANTIFTQGVDNTQNTWISSNSLYSQAAYAQANLASGGLSTANANTIYTQGVDLAQNNSISLLQGGLNTANANIAYILGVDLAQNTYAQSVNTYSYAAFSKANTSIQTSGGSITGNLNITGNLIVNGSNTFLGNIANVHIVGGNTGQVLSTDSFGNLSFIDLPTTNTISYVAQTISLTNGVYVSGSVTDVQTLNDGNFYSITDGSNTGPAWIITCTFTGVTSFNRIVSNVDYTLASGHTVYFQLYNYTTTVWDNIGSYSGSSGYSQYALEVLGYTSYISGGTVQARLYHSNTGNVAHATKLDYFALEKSAQGAQGPRGATGATGSTGATGPVDPSAFDRANSANSLAQSAYDKANTATNTTVYLTGALASENANSTLLFSYVNSANANIALIQGVNVDQNTRMSAIETVNTNQNTAITLIQAVDVYQNTRIDAAFTKANTGAVAVGYLANSVIFANSTGYLSNTSNIQFYTSNNTLVVANISVPTLYTTSGGIVFPDGTTQSTSASGSATDASARANTVYLQGALATANANTIYTQGVDLAQNNSITLLQGGLNTANANTVFLAGALNTANANTIFLSGVNSTQNTWISSNSLYSQAAFAQANLTAGGLVTANANTIYTQGVDLAQNNSITLLQGGLNTANANTIFLSGALATTNANTVFLSGVNSTQNTWISSNSLYSQAAFALANLTAGGLVTANSNITFTQGVDLAQNTSINNKLSLTGALNQTVSGNVTISQDLIVSGNLIITGNLNSLNVQSFGVADPLLVLGLGNYLSDTKDIGFAGHYNDGTNAHAGLIRDAVTKEFYFFKGYTPELDSNNNVIITDPSFSTANLNASYVKGNLIANTVVVNGIDLYNYASTAAANTVYLQGGLNTANANTIYTQGVDLSQNNSITLLQGGLNTANANTIFLQGALNTANANTIFLSGVNTSQNANIIAVQILANTDYTFVSSPTGTFGSSTLVPVVTVAANGRITNITTTAVSGGGGSSSNSFSTILVSGQPNVIANTATSPLTLVAGSGITITTVGTSNTITISSTGGFSGGTIANQLIVANTYSSYSNSNNALQVSGGVGVANSVYVGNRVGFGNTTTSLAYTTYNSTFNSIDTIFG